MCYLLKMAVCDLHDAVLVLRPALTQPMITIETKSPHARCNPEASPSTRRGQSRREIVVLRTKLTYSPTAFFAPQALRLKLLSTSYPLIDRLEAQQMSCSNHSIYGPRSSTPTEGWEVMLA